MKKAAATGSFDPIHNGHTHVIEKGIAQFGAENFSVIVGVNSDKIPLFHHQERIELINSSLGQYKDKIKLVFSQDLLPDYFVRNQITTNVKGLRSDSDLLYEKNLELYSKMLFPKMEFEYVLSKPEHVNLSSSGLKSFFKEGCNFSENISDCLHLSAKHALELRLNGQGVIGVTGVAGGGKSYVCEKVTQELTDMNIPTTYVSMDRLVHEIYSNPQYGYLVQEITEQIDNDVVDEQGQLDRKKLGAIVFNDLEKMNKLNSILRQPVLTELRYKLRGVKGMIVIENALFAEMGLTQLVNNNLVHVTTDSGLQVQRLVGRGSHHIEGLKNAQLDGEGKSQIIQDRIKRLHYGKEIIYENTQEGGIDHSLAVDMLSTADRDGSIRITSALTKLGLGQYAKEIYTMVRNKYMDNNLPYHGRSHILDGLDQIYRHYHLFKNPELVVVAWLFHDIIYDTTQKENEKKSGQFACNTLRKYGLSEPIILMIYDLIMGTTHSSALVDPDEQLLADIDLSILSSDSKRYTTYTQNIRKEYLQYSDTEYGVGRAYVMSRFLQRDKIYYTSAYQLLEQQARDNIQQEITQLQKYHA